MSRAEGVCQSADLFCPDAPTERDRLRNGTGGTCRLPGAAASRRSPEPVCVSLFRPRHSPPDSRTCSSVSKRPINTRRVLHTHAVLSTPHCPVSTPHCPVSTPHCPVSTAHCLHHPRSASPEASALPSVPKAAPLGAIIVPLLPAPAHLCRSGQRCSSWELLLSHPAEYILLSPVSLSLRVSESPNFITLRGCRLLPTTASPVHLLLQLAGPRLAHRHGDRSPLRKMRGVTCQGGPGGQCPLKNL